MRNQHRKKHPGNHRSDLFALENKTTSLWGILKMKILMVNVPAVREKTEGGEFVRETLVPLWRKNLELAKQPDTKLTFRFAEEGFISEDFADCRYLPSLNEAAMYDAVVQGEKDGFDAAVITCFSDYRLWEAREAVGIPVASIGEASMLMAASMGLKFGVVTLSEFEIKNTKQMIDQYGLSSRSVPPTAMDGNPAEQEKAIIDAHRTIESFTVAARKLIAGGADIIIPGCGLTSPALRLAPGAEQAYPQGFTEVDGVPIADALSNALLMAENLVGLKRAGSTWINCSGFHPDKSAETGVISDHGRFWDC
jgi:allantoin racemase